MKTLNKIWQHIFKTLMSDSFWVLMFVMCVASALACLLTGQFGKVFWELFLAMLAAACFFITRSRKGG